MKKNVKEWTILIYSNGNNELAPEMWQSKLDLEEIGSDSNVNVVMQIGLESRELVKIIRPLDDIPFTNEIWTGVRRYYISKGSSLLVKDMGKINMADHRNLYDFITWGIKLYPAKKYMVIISGHGASLIAALPDLSQDKPYMMGISEMCKTINMIKSTTGANIDVLCLDICYMNTIELIYEFGKKMNHTVKNMLTYIKDGPLTGMPYNLILKSVQNAPDYNNVQSIVKNTIENINLNLVAIQINHNKLKVIKELFNKLSYIQLMSERNQRHSSPDLLTLENNNLLYNKYNAELDKMLLSLIIKSKTIIPTDSKLIEIVTRDMYAEDSIDAFLPYYYKLAFCKNNYWTYLLSNKNLDENISIYSFPLSIFNMVPKGLRNMIWAMNPDLNEVEVTDITDKVYKYKQWSK